MAKRVNDSAKRAKRRATIQREFEARTDRESRLAAIAALKGLGASLSGAAKAIDTIVLYLYGVV